jgi:hypothetical protein
MRVKLAIEAKPSASRALGPAPGLLYQVEQWDEWGVLSIESIHTGYAYMFVCVEAECMASIAECTLFGATLSLDLTL